MHPDLIMLFLLLMLFISSVSLLIWGFTVEQTRPIKHCQLVEPNFNPLHDLIKLQKANIKQNI